ncbi:MAG TPA: hypothetical protein PKA82_00440, partial [Pyrinomonadaceae bacterium]|nr:hypothetical protein [Pyrinomonadaceae bacterium]
MKHTHSFGIRLVALLLSLTYVQSMFGQEAYFPPKGTWERRTADQVKLDPVKLKEAVDFAIANESKSPRSQELGQTRSFGQAPFGEIIGVMKDRGNATGIIIRNGYIVSEWGETSRVDMT